MSHEFPTESKAKSEGHTVLKFAELSWELGFGQIAPEKKSYCRREAGIKLQQTTWEGYDPR